MSKQQRDDSGQYGKKVTDQDVLKVFDYADEPVLTAAEVADELPLSQSAMNTRLNRMREDGLVARKKTGARAVVWWADESAFARELSRKSIASQHGDDYFSQNPGWADDLPDLGENA